MDNAKDPCNQERIDKKNTQSGADCDVILNPKGMKFCAKW